MYFNSEEFAVSRILSLVIASLLLASQVSSVFAGGATYGITAEWNGRVSTSIDWAMTYTTTMTHYDKKEYPVSQVLRTHVDNHGPIFLGWNQDLCGKAILQMYVQKPESVRTTIVTSTEGRTLWYAITYKNGLRSYIAPINIGSAPPIVGSNDDMLMVIYYGDAMGQMICGVVQH